MSTFAWFHRQNVATAFQGTHVFELFFLIVLRQYDMLVDRWVDYTKKLTRTEIKAIIQVRLRTCWWGLRADPAIKLQGREIGNFDMFDGNATKPSKAQ